MAWGSSHCQEEETYTSTLLELMSAAAVETEVPFDDIRVAPRLMPNRSGRVADVVNSKGHSPLLFFFAQGFSRETESNT